MSKLNEIIRYLRGYVKIKIDGEYTEEFINICVAEGIQIWGLEKISNSIFLFLGINDFLNIIHLRHKCRTKIFIRLIDKHGAPFLFNKYKKRKGIAIGLTMFFLINVFLSQFIWDIKINGNKTIDNTEIINYCKELGINLGDYKKNIDTYNAKQLLAMKFSNIAWVSLNVEGSILSINVSEADMSEHKEIGEPRNIVAGFDGVVKSIRVVKGQKCVTVDEAVKAGDIIVSGVVDNIVSSHMVAAEGEIIALTNRVYSYNIQKEFSFREISTDVGEKKVIEFFWLKVPLYLQGFEGEYTSKLTTEKLSLFGENLPISITTRVCFPISVEEFKISKQQAEQLAYAQIEKELRKIKLSEVISSELSILDKGENYLVTAEISCFEDIAEYKLINSDGY